VTTKRHHAINVVLDPEMHRAVLLFADRQNLTVSQAVRTLLRDALRIPSSTQDAGWREGYTAAMAAVKGAMAEALSKVDSVLTPTVTGRKRPR
jgi:hypothetical protein